MKTTRIFAALAVASVSATAFSQVLLETSFEAPAFTAGGSVAGIEGWANGSSTGGGFTVSSAQAASGTQSLLSDNTTLNSFYSVRNGLGGWTSAQGNLEVSVKVWVDSSTAPSRLYGLLLGGTATSTMGGTVLGLTIGGDGVVRAGSSWGATYTDAGILGTAPGAFSNRWLSIVLGYNPLTLEKTARISGFEGGGEISGSWTTGTPPSNVNVGSDYSVFAGSFGFAYFDDFKVQVPIAGTQISGQIAFSDWTASPALPVTIEVRDANTNALIATENTTTDGSGNYTVTIPTLANGGTYTVSADGAIWLRRTLNVVGTGSALSGINFSLPTGDVDGSGEVDAADIDAVIADFGASPIGFSPTDVDGSGEVDAADIDIVIANFGASDE